MQYTRILIAGVALAATLFFTGCATITRGTTETILIQSTPSGAQVRLSSGFTGITPASFTVSRKGDIVVSISKEGYESSDVVLKSGISGGGTAGFLGNALIGGVIGGGVDIATGATLSHTPNPLVVTLFPKAAPAAPAADTKPAATVTETRLPAAAVTPSAAPAAAPVPTAETKPATPGTNESPSK